MSIYVFLGPTLAVERARALLDATYLPPVACGDVQALFERHERPTAIAIIDGFFRTRPAVFHKEILFALDQGVPVYGASSMGALRGAELAAFGMVGVGRVFEAFRSGEIEDDDEVAIVHGPAEQGYAALSDAMVNLRMGLAQAVAAEVLPEASARRLVELAKATFYAERSWQLLFARGAEAGIAADEMARLRRFVKEQKPDAKRADAVALLERLAGAEPSTTARRPDFSFARSTRWRRLSDEVRRAARYGVSLASGVPIEDLALHARLFADPERTLLRDALFVHLVEQEASKAGVRASDDDVARRLAERGGAADAASRAAVRHEILLEGLTRSSSPVRPGIEGHLPTVLRTGLRLARATELVVKHWSTAAEAVRGGPSSGGEAHAASRGDQLVAWYTARVGMSRGTLETLAAAFDVDPLRLIEALAVAHEVEQRSAGAE